MQNRAHYAVSFAQWLREFLQARQLQQPDERMLYRYQTSKIEYEQLKTLLTQYVATQLEGDGLSERLLLKDQYFAACFVLFCAEWYRREYRSEWGWSWKPIFKELGFCLAATIRGELVSIGLEGYWKRELSIYSNERRNILGSIFREGGLPFSALRESGNRFHRFFSNVLKSYEDFRKFNYSTRRLISDRVYQAGLPQVFLEEESIDLLALMADELANLVNTYELAEKENPSKTLDKLNPNWRESFPILLDAEVSRDFINSLLQSASREIKGSQYQQKLLECRHYFTLASPERLLTEVFFPNEIDLQLKEEVESSRLELAIYEGTRLVCDLGPYYAECTEYRFKIKNLPSVQTVFRAFPNRRLHLVFSIYGNRIKQLEIPNSFIDVGDVPLGFELGEDGNYKLIGQSSFKVKVSDIRLWIPLEAEIEILEGRYEILSQNENYKSLQIYGPCQLKIKTTEKFNISTGAEHEWSQSLALSGKVVPWETKPAAVFIGMPQALVDSDIEQGQDFYYLEKISLHLSGQPCSKVIEQNNYGVHYLSVRNEKEETVLRRKVGILPPDFHLELGRGGTPQEGMIWIKTQYPVWYELLNEGIKSHHIYDQNNPEYEGLFLSCEKYPPPTVDISFRFGTADPVIVTLPFPSSGFCAFDGHGNSLPKSIAVEELLGSRLYLFSDSGSTEYELSLSLKGEKPLNLDVFWKIRVSEIPKEVELFSLTDEIERLLSLQFGINRYVELLVNSKLVCRIRRYATDLYLDLNQWLLRWIDSSGSNGTAYPEPVLMCVSEPEHTPISISMRYREGVIYDLPQNLDRSLPWLVIPKKGSALSFHPELIHLRERYDQLVEHAPSSTSVINLRHILRDYDKSELVHLLDQVIAQMATHANHNGWQYIKTLYNNYNYLPLATFDAWLALMRNPLAIAMAAFHFEMQPEFLQRLSKRFPFAWELFPIHNFLVAEQRFFDYLFKLGLTEQRSGEIRKVLYKNLVVACPFYEDIVSLWLSQEVTPIPTSSEFIKTSISEWHQKLLQERATAIWPEMPAHQELKRWVQQQDIYAVDAKLDYRNTVTYMPYFAAAVAAGKIKQNMFFQDEVELIFYLRQARDFDTQWFNAVYRYALYYFCNESK